MPALDIKRGIERHKSEDFFQHFPIIGIISALVSSSWLRHSFWPIEKFWGVFKLPSIERYFMSLCCWKTSKIALLPNRVSLDWVIMPPKREKPSSWSVDNRCPLIFPTAIDISGMIWRTRNLYFNYNLSIIPLTLTINLILITCIMHVNDQHCSFAKNGEENHFG